jgi:hypothetical protein
MFRRLEDLGLEPGAMDFDLAAAKVRNNGALTSRNYVFLNEAKQERFRELQCLKNMLQQ